MSLLADPRQPAGSNNYQGLLLAFVASVALHMLVVIAYMWTPEYEFAPPPQAAPIAVSFVAPLATKKSRFDGEISLTEQQEIISHQPPAPIESKLEATNSVPPVVESPKPTPAALPSKSTKQTVDKQTVDKQTNKTIDNRPKPPKPVKKVEQVNDHPTVSQKAQTTTNLQSSSTANQHSAPRRGQLSEQGKAANISWKQAMHAHLEREKRYPRKAKRAKKQGMPVIRFTMDRNGNVINVILVKSSGTKSLDKEAVELVYRAQPLIKPPKSISGEKIKLTLPISFSF